MKKPLHIMTLIEDYDIWKEILGLVERTDNLKLLFGGGAFIIDNRDYGLGRGNRSEDEIDTLQECIRRHIWAIKNTNNVGMRGARNVDTPCKIRKAVTDERGHLCNGKGKGGWIPDRPDDDIERDHHENQAQGYPGVRFTSEEGR